MVQLPNHVQLFPTPWTAALQASLYLTISQSLPKSMSIESVMPSNHLLLCHLLLLLPSISPSIRVFSKESAVRIRWPRYSSFSFSISLSNEYSGQISFKMDWFDLLAVQGTLAPQFESIHSLGLSFLYSPTLPSTHDHWKNYNSDYMDLCWQSNISAFQYAIQVGHNFPSKEQAPFNFMTAITICSDFGAPENKV